MDAIRGHDEFYSVTNNGTMWLEGKWMQLEDMMLSKVSQVQRDKGCMFSLTWGRSSKR
jgi:hypothetical protein